MEVALALVFINTPKLLILHDPGIMIDHKTKIWMRSYLKDIKSTVIFISHEKTFINSIIDEILYIDEYGSLNNYETLSSVNEKLEIKTETWNIPVINKVKLIFILIIVSIIEM